MVINSNRFSKFENRDLDFLRQVVGLENVSVEDSELLIHAVDAFHSKWVEPESVVWPETTEQVSQIVRYADKRRIPIVPRGAGSSLSGNVVPAHHGIVLSFRKMNRILRVLDDDLQVVVQPGVVYDDLNAELESH